MSKAEIRKRIYLTGQKLYGYTVICDMPGAAITCFVSTTKIGNAIVRALRELAHQEQSNGRRS